jgi:hypothetical protein
VEKSAASCNLPHFVIEIRFQWKADWWKKVRQVATCCTLGLKFVFNGNWIGLVEKSAAS